MSEKERLEEEQVQFLKNLGIAINRAAKEADRSADALHDLTSPASRLAKQVSAVDGNFLRLDTALKKGRTTYIQSIDSIKALTEQIDEMADSEEKRERERKLADLREKAATAVRNKFVLEGLGELVKGVYSATTGVAKSLVSSYQSGASAFSTFGEAQMAGMDATNNFTQNLLKGGSAAAMGLGALGVISGGAAFAVAGLATVIGGIFSAGQDAAKAGVQIAVKEMEATTKSYGDATRAGAVFADGIEGVRQGSVDAYLTMVQFAKIISENSAQLMMYGGTVTRGVESFKRLNAEMSGYRTGLIAMGMSIEDIAAGTAEYMGMIGTVSSKQRTDYVNLAKETEGYLVNLKLVSAFTGQDAKKAEAEAQKRATQAAVQAKIMRSENPERELAKFKNAIKIAGPGMEDAVSQLYATGVYAGDTAMLMAQLPTAGKGIADAVDLVKDNSINLEQMTARMIDTQILNSRQNKEEALNASQTFGTVAILGQGFTQLADILSAYTLHSNKLTKLQGTTADQMVAQLLGVKALGKDTKTITGVYAKVVEEGQDLQINVQLALNPVIEVFGEFAKVTGEILTTIKTNIGGLDITPGTGTARPPSIPVTPPRAGGGGGGGNPPANPNGGGGGGNPPAVVGGVPPAIPGNVLPYAQTGAAMITPKLQEMIKTLALQNIPGLTITGLNDGDIFEKHKVGKHAEGKAMDFTFKGYNPDDPTTYKQIIEMLKGMGFNTAQAEKKGVGDATGDHIHAELLANGGITNGLSLAGEAGPEAVIPLPDGRTIPVRMDVSALIDKLDELLDVMKDQHSTSEQMLSAVA